MKRIIDFLGRLAANNNRVWFNAHKEEYLACKASFDDFVDRLIEAIRSFDDSVGPMTAKDCTYRIYRDTRFSSDKTPYKTHMGAFICPGGKKSGFAGYYFQVGPSDSGTFTDGCVLATGDYCCDPKVVKILREDIVMDSGAAFGSALEAAKGFRLDPDGSLKRCPAGFPADKPFSEWLKLKNFCLVGNVGTNYVLRPGLVKRLADDFSRTKPFLDLLNRAIDYARTEP